MSKSEAKDFARPMFKKARATGKPVAISSKIADREECDKGGLRIINLYAMPDGKIKMDTGHTITLSTNLKAAREASGLSADEAAELCGVSRATWYAYEIGRTDPPLARLVEIAGKLGTTAAKLLKGV